MEKPYKPEFDMTPDTLEVLCNIALGLDIEHVYTNKGYIDTDSYSFVNHNGGILEKDVMNSVVINECCQAIYQRIPEEKLYWKLHIDKWKSKGDLNMFSMRNNAIAFLTTNELQLNLIPEELTVYKSLNHLMKGEKLGFIDCGADFFEVGMKCIYVMLEAINNDVFYDNKDYTYQQFMIDVRTIADAHNPTV